MKRRSGLALYLGRVALAATLIVPMLAPLAPAHAATPAGVPSVRAGARTAGQAAWLPASAAALRNDIVERALAGRASLEDPAVRAALAESAESLSRSERQALSDLYYHQIIADQTDLEAFARLSELAAILSAGGADKFVADLSWLALDATGNWQALVAGPWGRAKNAIHARLPWFPGYPALLRFGCQGFARADGGNQVQHFWYAVAVSYRYGVGLAALQARYHEWNAPGLLNLLPGTAHGAGSDLDLALSAQGIALGQALASGQMDVSEVAGWMRENLG